MVTSPSLLSGLTSTPGMESVFSDANLVQQMLRFEGALSAALEECGLAPGGSATPFAVLEAAPFLTPERATRLREAAAAAGNLAIPFVKLLTTLVVEQDPVAAGFVHTGATSQDVLDTALVLQMRDGLALLVIDLDRVHGVCVALAQTHAATVMAGRTWLQQGPPVTLGLKIACCAAALGRSRDRLTRAGERAVQLQFGGAVGTLASLGEHGLRVSAALARRLDLPEAPLPWHTHRDALVEVAAALGILIGTLGKMARDVSLLMQTEVGEVLEPSGEGRGGSSTMPHKRNPVGCAAILAAAVRAPGLVATMLTGMTQEHERGLGGWQAEWTTLPELFRLSATALAQAGEIVSGLDVQVERMAENLDRSGGLNLAEAVSSALAPFVGRAEAHRLLEAASRAALAQGQPLAAVLAATPEITAHLSETERDRLLDPRHYLGSTQAFIERALAPTS